MDTIADIEEHVRNRAEDRLKLIPKNITKQLARIEKVVFHQFKLESHWKGQVQLDCFDAVMNSRMTLNELESIIKAEGKKLAVKKSFTDALKYITKTINKSKKMSAFKNSVKNKTLLKNIIGGNRPTK